MANAPPSLNQRPPSPRDFFSSAHILLMFDSKHEKQPCTSADGPRVEVYTVKAEEEVVADAVFGEVGKGGTNYNTVRLVRCSLHPQLLIGFHLSARLVSSGRPPYENAGM